MSDYYSPNETQMRSAVKGEDRHSKKRFWWLRLIVRGLLVAILAFAFFAALFIVSEVIVSMLD